MGINMMIEDTLRELAIMDRLRNNEPLHHDEAYAAYEVRVDLSEDPRSWFSDLR